MWSAPRLANVTLGLWLILSAVVWPHTTLSRTNAWVVGLIIALIAAVGTPSPIVRAISTVPAIWLFFSSFWMSHVTNATVWNNAIVAVLVVVFALVPTRDKSITRWP